MTFRDKLDRYHTVRYEIDGHVWEVFYRYIKEEGINFNGPEHWTFDEDSIRFSGQDGCMGCYDPMSLYIPIHFFDDPNTAFAELKRDKELKKELETQAKLKYKENMERKLYEELRAKFGDDYELNKK